MSPLSFEIDKIKRWNKRKLFFLLGSVLALLTAMFSPPNINAENLLMIEIKEQLAELTIYFKKQPLLVYTFGANQFKPYIKELYTLSGQNVLRDAPADHLHHHGMMYAITVNGISFWEETAAVGIQRPVKLMKQQGGTNPNGLHQASFTQLIYWIDRADLDRSDATRALLIERRTITLTVDEGSREVAVQWDSAFEVGVKANKVTLTGDFYNGLGLRFPKEFDAVAMHRNSENGPDLRKRKQGLSKARWSSVAFDLPTKPATVAIFGHPANARGDAVFFTMLDPFTYLSATQGLDKEPLKYAAEATFNLIYLVAVYPELKTPEFLEQRARLWSAEKPGAIHPGKK